MSVKNVKGMNKQESMSRKAAWGWGLLALTIAFCLFQMMGICAEANEIDRIVKNGVDTLSNILGWAAVAVTAVLVFLAFTKRAWTQGGITLAIGALVSFIMFNLENIKSWGETLSGILFQ